MTRTGKLILSSLALAATASAQTASGYDWGAEFVNLTNQMVSSYGGLLLQDGMTELGYLCAILVFWEFIKWGMARFAAPHHGHFPLPLPEVGMIFAKTAFLAYLLNHYMVNFPLTGFSFHSLAMAFSQHITMQISQAQTDSMMDFISNPAALVALPVNPLAVIDSIVYLAVILLMGILSFGMFVLGGLGFVFSGVFTLVGPIIIPWWLLRGHPAAWAWNWLQVMFAVASYRVIGAAMSYIMSSVWLDFFHNTLAGDYSAANWIAHGGAAIFLTLFFLLGMTMVPLFAAQIFNGAGAAAQAAGGAIIGAAQTAVKVGGAIASAL
jgi:hypothetical protein